MVDAVTAEVGAAEATAEATAEAAEVADTEPAAAMVHSHSGKIDDAHAAAPDVVPHVSVA